MHNRDDGRCKHGVYVGGCGIDWMCGACEDGVSDEDYAESLIAADRADAYMRNRMYDALLAVAGSRDAIPVEAMIWIRGR